MVIITNRTKNTIVIITNVGIIYSLTSSDGNSLASDESEFINSNSLSS